MCYGMVRCGTVRYGMNMACYDAAVPSPCGCTINLVHHTADRGVPERWGFSRELESEKGRWGRNPGDTASVHDRSTAEGDLSRGRNHLISKRALDSAVVDLEDRGTF